MSKRLFTAIPLDKDSLRALEKYRDTMGKDTPFFHWTQINNLHITLVFFGDVSEEKIPALSEELEKIAANTKSFNLIFDHAIYAPPNRPTSMIWFKMKESEDFFNLAESINKINKNKKEQLDFIPHITLARLKNDALVPRLPKLEPTGIENFKLKIENFDLMESKLTPSGPIYKTLDKYNLTMI